MVLAESRLALPCGHVFHQACIQKYASCKNTSVERACPYRCTLTADATVVMDDPSEPSSPEAEHDQKTPEALGSDLENLVQQAFADASSMA